MLYEVITYWYPNAEGNYSGLQKLAASKLEVKATKIGDNKVKVVLKNPAGAPVAFFNHLSIVDEKTNERVLPIFADDNYVSVVPGAEKTIILDCPQATSSNWKLAVDGYNFEQQYFNIQ